MPPGHPFPEPDPERWFALLDDPAVSLVVVEDDDGALLGVSACGESRDDDVDDSVGEVRSFFVAPGRWRGGVGLKLMEGALDSLRERGCAVATVWSFRDNERANAFYERLGFERDGAEEPTDETWASLPGIRYRRNLY